jgi:hypothetical protein
MKIREEIQDSIVEDDLLVFVPSEKNFFVITGIGIIIFNEIKEGKTTREIISKITQEYNIDKETAEKDVNSFIKSLKEKKII